MTRLRTPSLQHGIHVIAYVMWVLYVTYNNLSSRLSVPDTDYQDPIVKYGPWITYFSIGVRLLSILILPQMFAMAVGFLLFDIRQQKPELKASVSLAPFICIRMVTRGLYATLVNQNVKSHMEVMNQLGLTNFSIEVVTDNPLKLDLTDHELKFVKQIVGKFNSS